MGKTLNEKKLKLCAKSLKIALNTYGLDHMVTRLLLDRLVGLKRNF